VRHLTAFSAGASLLEFRNFSPYAYSGGFFWVATFLALGYVLGEEWPQITPQIQTYLWLALAAGLLLALAAYLLWRWQQRPQPK
jgi:membrane protein DedA with SNARE-associated domain